jgi:hypothetical protein
MMTRAAMRWSGKTLMWLLVCLVAIATSDDFWSMAMASPSGQLLLVADDDDPDDSAERMPACASGGVGYIDVRWFARKATDVIQPADLRNGFVLRYGPRGPPPDGSDEHIRANSSCFWPATVDSSFAAPLPVTATPHHKSFKVQSPADLSRNRTSGANSSPRCELSTCESAVAVPYGA